MSRQSKLSAFFARRTVGGSVRAKTRPQSRKETPILFAVLALGISLGTPWTVKAQVAGGSITGTVTAESGGAMPDVHVSIKDVSSGVARTATTNTSGLYSVPNLSPGSYEMTVSASGFTTQLWTDITVAAGVERILNVVMRAGNPEQVVRVAAPPALVSEPCPAVCGSASASTVPAMQMPERMLLQSLAVCPAPETPT